MALVFGKVSEFDDEVTIADPVMQVAAKVAKVGPNVGAFYDSMGPLTVPLTTKDFKIYNRSKSVRQGTIATNNWSATGTSSLKISAAFAECITVGHVLQVEDEVVIVSAVDRASNAISVYERGTGGTSAVTHNIGVVIDVIGYAGRDQDLKNVESVSESTSDYTNYIQTVFEALDWEHGTELERKGLEADNIVLILIKEAQQRVYEMLARMAVRGVKVKGAKNGSPYMSAGLLSQLSDTRDNRKVLIFDGEGKEFDEDMFRAVLKKIIEAGGSPDTVWVSSNIRECFNSFTTGVIVNRASGDHSAGMYIDSYNYNGHIVKIRVDADMPDNKLAVVTQSKCKKGWLKNDALRKTNEPTASTREKRDAIQGSVGFLIEDVGTDHILLSNFVPGATKPVQKVQVSNSKDNPIPTTDETPAPAAE